MTTDGNHYDVLIAGQGAAGFAAGLYAARYQMRTIVLGETFGGETATGGSIENYPGFAEIDGFELMMKFKEQVEGYDVPIVAENVASVAYDGHLFRTTSSEGAAFTSTSVVLAVGRERRKLGLGHEEEWTGRGVSFCSTCDAPLHRGNVVAAVGGGNAAVEGAILLGKYARQVYIIYRRDSFTRPEPVTLRLLDEADNVRPIFNTSVIGLKGTDGLEGVVLDRPVDGSTELALDGLFIEIGADPRVEIPNQLGLDLNEVNEVIVDKAMRTNVPGVFAAGDLTDASGDLKQTVTAAAQGAVAATSAYAWVSEHASAQDTNTAGYSAA